jgi:hypothetical protein
MFQTLHSYLPQIANAGSGRHKNEIPHTSCDTLRITRDELHSVQTKVIARQRRVEIIEWAQAIGEAAVILLTAVCIVWIITYGLLLLQDGTVV